MALLLALLMAVACPYAMLQGVFMSGSTAILLGAGYYIMGSFCHLGQTFVNQVSEAEGLLKDLIVKSHILNFNLKVSQVMGRLSHNLAFDMCGWYRLDHAALLGLLNTVLTYLVILFQVGGTAVKSHIPTSPPPSNASAPADPRGPHF
ncbi:uncharacterized protein LOC126995216 [Eriocheir sinensis]|uniref:uncharacterized protein LOC126995216 n=1 Tax=Eriocheir sinensis TaxID=95602 RepID=UPI0021CA365D|nr:uncharacterized protein LOC126995216 [Eriocheir sinensis]